MLTSCPRACRRSCRPPRFWRLEVGRVSPGLAHFAPRPAGCYPRPAGRLTLRLVSVAALHRASSRRYSRRPLAVAPRCRAEPSHHSRWANGGGLGPASRGTSISKRCRLRHHNGRARPTRASVRSFESAKREGRGSMNQPVPRAGLYGGPQPLRLSECPECGHLCVRERRCHFCEPLDPLLAELRLAQRGARHPVMHVGRLRLFLRRVDASRRRP